MASIYQSSQGAVALANWYTRALATLPVPYETRYIHTRYGETHLIATGPPDGPPVVLLHGLNINAAIWGPQFPALVAAGFRVYALDIIGQPGRSAQNRPSFVGSAYARWMQDVLDELAINQAHLVGLSLGGYIAMKTGVLLPSRVDRVVLLAPAGLTLIRPWMGLQIVATNLPFRSYTEATRDVVRRILNTPGVEAEADITHAAELMELVNAHQGPLRGPRQLLEGAAPGLPILTYELRRMAAPTLVLIGENDAIFDAGTVCERARMVLPGLVKAEVIPEAGHALTYQRTGIVNHKISYFLQNLPGY